MFWTILGGALMIFVLRLIQVALGTVRTILVVRGMRKWAALAGFVEVSIYVVAISKVLSDMSSIWNLIGYSGGFSVGTLVGMWIEDRIALGDTLVTAISLTKGVELADKVRQEGYGATHLTAEGQSGPVHQVEIVAPRKQVRELMRLINEVDATAFVTVTDARSVLRGVRPLMR